MRTSPPDEAEERARFWRLWLEDTDYSLEVKLHRAKEVFGVLRFGAFIGDPVASAVLKVLKDFIDRHTPQRHNWLKEGF